LIGDVVGDAAAAEVSAKEFAATDGDAGEVRLSAPATSIAQPESSPVPEAELLSRAQTGDHLAFAQIYNLYKKRIYSLCLRMVGNAAEAEDLTQEAFLQLHRKIATFRGDSAFFTWLHRLTINVVLMQLRKKGLPILSMNEAMDSDSDGAPAQDFGAPDPALTSSIDRMALQRAVDELPAGYRLVFVLHDIEGYEHHEIAALLDCSIGNSKSQLHKARLKLRNALRSDPKQEARP
jgi:RNA polymerase sigma-70 factor (ECF subfamily)